MDWLGVGALIGGAAQGIGSALDTYLFTEQEKAQAGLTAQQIAAQQAAVTQQGQVMLAREETTQKAVVYGLAGVLGVGGLYLAAQLVKR